MENEDFDFYKMVFREILKINCRKRIIPFPLVFYRLGTIFHFDKNNSKIILKILERRGLIKIIPFKGIRLSGQELHR